MRAPGSPFLFLRFVRLAGCAAALVLGACGSGAGDGSAGVGEDVGGGESLGAQGSPARGVVGDGLVEEVAVGETCAPRVAAETFASAVCSCEDMRVAGYLRTTSFRSGPRAGLPDGA